ASPVPRPSTRGQGHGSAWFIPFAKHSAGASGSYAQNSTSSSGIIENPPVTSAFQKSLKKIFCLFAQATRLFLLQIKYSPCLSGAFSLIFFHWYIFISLSSRLHNVQPLQFFVRPFMGKVTVWHPPSPLFLPSFGKEAENVFQRK